MKLARRAARGVYILANDRVIDQTLALLNSLRRNDPHTPVCLIPYDAEIGLCLRLLSDFYGVRLFPRLRSLARLNTLIRQTFGAGLVPRANNLRKHACWLGPYDEFLYLDTDILVFERISGMLDHLSEFDFVCCDDQHRSGLAHVFSPSAVADGFVEAGAAGEIFNAGLWGARRELVSEPGLRRSVRRCSAAPRYLDLSRGGSDQPFTNYLVLGHTRRRLNLYRDLAGEPRMWAGTPGLIAEGDRVVDPAVDRPLRFLHWAGTPRTPGTPYYEIWRHYRELRPEVSAELERLRSRPRPRFSASRRLRKLVFA